MCRCITIVEEARNPLALGRLPALDVIDSVDNTPIRSIPDTINISVQNTLRLIVSSGLWL